MENASKALIIAGAILISILIIGLGVFIYNQAKGAIGNTGIDAQAAESNNQQFTAYFGNNKSAAEVKNLISLVRSYNINQTTSSGGYGIGFYFGTADFDSSTGATTTTLFFKSYKDISSEIKSGKTYTISATNDEATTQTEDTAEDVLTATTPTLTSDKGYYSNGFLRLIKIVYNI